MTTGILQTIFTGITILAAHAFCRLMKIYYATNNFSMAASEPTQNLNPKGRVIFFHPFSFLFYFSIFSPSHLCCFPIIYHSPLFLIYHSKSFNRILVLECAERTANTFWSVTHLAMTTVCDCYL